MPNIEPDDYITQEIIDEWNKTGKGRAALVWYDHVRKTMDQPLTNKVGRQQTRFSSRKMFKYWTRIMDKNHSDVVLADGYH